MYLQERFSLRAKIFLHSVFQFSCPSSSFFFPISCFFDILFEIVVLLYLLHFYVTTLKFIVKWLCLNYNLYLDSFTLTLQTCFFRQFGRSVVRADYLTLRKGFILVRNILMCQISMMNMSLYGFVSGNVSG